MCLGSLWRFGWTSFKSSPNYFTNWRHVAKLLHILFTFPNYHIEFTKLVEFMEIKILKILHTVKTWWINIFSLLIKIMARYWTLLVKMQQDGVEGEIAKENYDWLPTIQILISLNCLLPMLKYVHSLMHFTQKRNVFVCDYMAIIKRCHFELHNFYMESKTTFIHDVFWDFKALTNGKHDFVPLCWVVDPLDLNTDDV